MNANKDKKIYDFIRIIGEHINNNNDPIVEVFYYLLYNILYK